MKFGLAVAILSLTGSAASAHRLDEYLQGSLISVDGNRLEVRMTLTPGVAVYSFLIANIDTDANGAISQTEQRAYAAQVLRDLSIASDGHRLTPQLTSVQFPSLDEMKEGRGEIRLEFNAALPRGGGNRKLTIENHHQNRISAYLVNCLAPRDPNIHISAQTRNYSQSRYRLDYTQAGKPLVSPFSALSLVGLILFTRLLVLHRRHT